jgi:hypothetical protein
LRKPNNFNGKRRRQIANTGILKRDRVPSFKDFQVSTRENSVYKWQNRNVIGALEIDSEPDLNFYKMIPNTGVSTDHKVARFNAAQQAFRDFELHNLFLEVASTFPVQMSCFGMIRDDAKTIRALVPYLNETWAPQANLILKSVGFRVDCFHWTWSHISGQSDSHILLIRFHDLDS